MSDATLVRAEVQANDASAGSGEQDDMPDSTDSLRALFKNMERSLMSVVSNAQHQEELARLHVAIANFKQQVYEKDCKIHSLSRELADKNKALCELNVIKRKHDDLTNRHQSSQHTMELELKQVSTQLEDANGQIKSLETIVAQLIDTGRGPTCEPPRPAPGIKVPQLESGSEQVPESESPASHQESDRDCDNSTESEGNSESQPSSTPAQAPDTQPAPPVRGHGVHGPETENQHNGSSASPDAKSAVSVAGRKLDVLYVGNSQFRKLRPGKLHWNHATHVHTLYDKTLDGALEFFRAYKPTIPPKAVAIQVISNTLEATLDPNMVMAQLVKSVSIISQNCPGAHIAVGLPLPRKCGTPDLTAHYDVCREQVEERVKGLADKRANLTAVFCPELGTYHEDLFHDSRHLTFGYRRQGQSTGLGLLVSAYKSVISPILAPSSPSRTHWEDNPDRVHQRSSQRRSPQRVQGGNSYPDRRSRYVRRDNRQRLPHNRHDRPQQQYTPQQHYSQHQSSRGRINRRIEREVSPPGRYDDRPSEDQEPTYEYRSDYASHNRFWDMRNDYDYDREDYEHDRH